MAPSTWIILGLSGLAFIYAGLQLYRLAYRDGYQAAKEASDKEAPHHGT